MGTAQKKHTVHSTSHGEKKQDEDAMLVSVTVELTRHGSSGGDPSVDDQHMPGDEASGVR